MAKMTQKELAAQLGISVSTLSEYESGKYDPRSDILCEIAIYAASALIFYFAVLQRKKSPLSFLSKLFKSRRHTANLMPAGKI